MSKWHEHGRHIRASHARFSVFETRKTTVLRGVLCIHQVVMNFLLRNVSSRHILKTRPSRDKLFAQTCSLEESYQSLNSQDNLVLSTVLIMWIGHCKEIRKLTFRALALRRSESRNWRLCVVYTQKDGVTLLVGTRSVSEWKAFVDIARIKSIDLKIRFCSRVFSAAFRSSLM